MIHEAFQGEVRVTTRQRKTRAVKLKEAELALQVGGCQPKINI